MWRRDRLGLILPLSGLLVVTGLATVVLVIPQLAASQAAASPVGPLDRFRYVADLYASTMSGGYLYLLVTKRPLSGGKPDERRGRARIRRPGAGEPPCGASRAVAQARMPFRDRVLLFHLAIFVLIAVQLLITKKAWGPHHIMMLYPFQLFDNVRCSRRPCRDVGGRTVAVRAGGFGPPCRRRLPAGLSTHGRIRAAVEPGRLRAGRLPESPSRRAHRLGRLGNAQSDLGPGQPQDSLNSPGSVARLPDTRATPRARSSCTEEISRDCTWWPFSTAPAGTSCRPCGRISWRGPRPSASCPRLERVFTSPAGAVVFEVYAVDGAGTPSGR